MKYSGTQYEECKDKIKRVYGLPPYDDYMNPSRYDNYAWAAIQHKYSSNMILAAMEELGIIITVE